MATSIIQIDVKDEKFKAFNAAFNKYRSAVDAMPKSWGKVGDSIKKSANDTDKALKGVIRTNKDLNKSLGDSYNTLRNVGKVSGNIARNFASAAVSVAKWVALGGISTGFGVGFLASSASSYRRQSQGLGVSTGDLRAAKTNFGKYIDVNSTLGNIADIKGDLSRSYILNNLGGSANKSASEMLPDIITGAISKFKQGGQTSQYADALGLTQVFSLEELRRLSSLTEQELSATIEQFRKDRESLKVSDSDSKALQDFWVQIKRAGEEIETSFVKVIAEAAPLLKEFSVGISKAISNFLKSDDVKEALSRFVSYLNSDEVRSDIKSFMEAVRFVTSGITAITSGFTLFAKSLGFAVANKFGFSVENANDLKAKADRDYLAWSDSLPRTPLSDTGKLNSSISEKFNNPGNLRSWKGFPTIDSGTSSGAFAKFNTKEEGLRALAQQLRLYQNRDNLNSISQIIGKYSPSNENNTAAAIANISKLSGFKANERLDLNNTDTLSRLISAITKQENSQSNYRPEAISKVIVTNAAGSDLVVTSNALK